MNRPRHPDRRRPGFTLVEILVVITILGILVALLVPAITGAVNTAKNAQVTTDINNMAQALASFKNLYGDYPPSRVILLESGDYNGAISGPLGSQPLSSSNIPWLGTASPQPSTTDLTFGELAQRSLRYLRKFFPRANGLGPGGVFYDFNNSGGTGPNGPMLLQGHESLVFFLGGIPSTSTPFSMTGFSNNPTNPFQNEATTTNRRRTMFDFVGDRLIDEDNDRMPGYVDPRGPGASPGFYAYFSAYGGGGYDPNDVNFAEPNDNNQPIGRAFRVSFTVTAPAGIPPQLVVSPAPNPYTTSQPVSTTSPVSYQNNESFQIISPGRDRLYGVGGQFLTSGTGDRLPIADVGATYHAQSGLDESIRRREGDNLTNFASSTLD